MRIDLNRIRDIDRTIVLTILALAAGIAVSGWLVADVSKREKLVDTLAAEVAQKETQAGALPQDTAAPLSGEELAEKVLRLVAPAGAEEELREELAMLAAEHHLEGFKTESATTAVDPASADVENALLMSLGVPSYTDITIEFQAEYDEAARFMDAVEKLPQRVLIKTAEMGKAYPKVGGRLILRAYQKGP